MAMSSVCPKHPLTAHQTAGFPIPGGTLLFGRSRRTDPLTRSATLLNVSNGGRGAERPPRGRGASPPPYGTPSSQRSPELRKLRAFYLQLCHNPIGFRHNISTSKPPHLRQGFVPSGGHPHAAPEGFTHVGGTKARIKARN